MGFPLLSADPQAASLFRDNSVPVPDMESHNTQHVFKKPTSQWTLLISYTTPSRSHWPDRALECPIEGITEIAAKKQFSARMPSARYCIYRYYVPTGRIHASGNQEEEGVAPLTIIPNDPWGWFVFHILITLISSELEVLSPKGGALCQGTQLSLKSYVTKCRVPHSPQFGI